MADTVVTLTGESSAGDGVTGSEFQAGVAVAEASHSADQAEAAALAAEAAAREAAEAASAAVSSETVAFDARVEVQSVREELTAMEERLMGKLSDVSAAVLILADNIQPAPEKETTPPPVRDTPPKSNHWLNKKVGGRR